LGAYLTGTPLTPAQVTIVNTAIAEYGPAPVGNIQVIQQPVAKPAAPAQVKVPNTVGMTLAHAQSVVTAAGLKFSGPRGEPGTTKVNGQNPRAGTVVTKGTTVVTERAPEVKKPAHPVKKK
jgi:beta-lactam-binding protein with PASTA domain